MADARDRDVAFGRLAIERRLVARELVRDCFRSSPGPLRDALVSRGILTRAQADELDRLIDAQALDATLKLAPPAGRWTTSGAFPAVKLDESNAGTVRLPPSAAPRPSGRVPRPTPPPSSGRIPVPPGLEATVRTPSGQFPVPPSAFDATVRTPSGRLPTPPSALDATVRTATPPPPPAPPEAEADPTLVTARLAPPAASSSSRTASARLDAPTSGGAPGASSARTRAERTPSGSFGKASALPGVGDVVGGYRIVSLLGKGGMGAVFRAVQEGTDAEVALKVMQFEGDEALVYAERFRREVQALAKVDRHPGVVRIHTAGVFGVEGLPYCVMDLVKGQDLSKVVKQAGRMDAKRAFEVVAKIARALEHCHERKIIHRDLKPQNVLLREDDGQPLLLDFGLARDAELDRMTKTGQMLGTPAYLSPEQADGQWKLQDARTDVYGIGAILYECLTGRPPFEGDSIAVVLKKVLRDDPPHPDKVAPGLPRGAADVALRCLAKERHRRYPTARAVAEDLERLARGERPLARAPGALERWGDRARKHKLLAGGIALVIASVPALIAGQRHVARREHDAASAIDAAWTTFRGVASKQEGGALEARAPGAAPLAELADARAALGKVRSGPDVDLARDALVALALALEARTQRLRPAKIAETVALLEGVTARAESAFADSRTAALAEDTGALLERLDEPERAARALAKVPGAAALEARARCLVALDEPEDAARLLRGAPARAPALRALALARAGESGAALGELERLAPSGAEALLARAETFAALGSHAAAVVAARAAERDLATARKPEPIGQTAPAVQIAHVLLDAGRADEAIQAFERALVWCDELVALDEGTLARRAARPVDLVPGVQLRADALGGLARAWLLAGEPAKAREVLERLARGASIGQRVHARALAARAVLAQLEGDGDVARDLARRAVASRPGDARLALELAVKDLVPADQLAGAVALGGRAARRALARKLIDALGTSDPKPLVESIRTLAPSPREESALAAVGAATPERARAAVAAAFALDGGDGARLLEASRAHDRVARWQVRWFRHRFAHGVFDAHNVLSLEERQGELAIVAGYVGYADAPHERERARAGSLLALAARADPWGGAAAVESAARVLRDGGRAEEALALLEHGARLAPADPDVEALLAWTLLTRGSVDPGTALRASQLAEHAALARPSCALAHAAHGLASVALGHPQAALESLALAIRTDATLNELAEDGRDVEVWRATQLAHERLGHAQEAIAARREVEVRTPGERLLRAHELWARANKLDDDIPDELTDDKAKFTSGAASHSQVVEWSARALEIDPHHPYARYLLVKNAMLGGVPRDDESMFWHIARFVHDDPGMHDDMDKLVTGVRSILSDQLERLRAEVGRPGVRRGIALGRGLDALLLDPDVPGRNAHKTDDALDAIEEVLASEPLDPFSLLQRGLLLALAPVDARKNERLRELYDRLAARDFERAERHVPLTRTATVGKLVLALRRGDDRARLLLELGRVWPVTERTCRFVTDLAERDPNLKKLVAEFLEKYPRRPPPSPDSR